MKKLFAIAMVIASVFAFCACGEPTVIEKEIEVPVEVPLEVPALPEEYLKYEDVLDALEAEDYDTARALIEELRPAPELPPVVEVEITADNFLDYFEYVELPQNNMRIERLSSGKPAAIFASSGFYLKEGYELDPVHAGESSVTADVKYTVYMPMYDVLDIDFDNLKYEVKIKLDKDNCYVENETKTLQSWYNAPDLCLTIPRTTALLNKYVNYAAVLLRNVKVVSASGTLYLYE